MAKFGLLLSPTSLGCVRGGAKFNFLVFYFCFFLLKKWFLAIS